MGVTLVSMNKMKIKIVLSRRTILLLIRHSYAKIALLAMLSSQVLTNLSLLESHTESIGKKYNKNKYKLLM